MWGCCSSKIVGRHTVIELLATSSSETSGLFGPRAAGLARSTAQGSLSWLPDCALRLAGFCTNTSGESAPICPGISHVHNAPNGASVVLTSQPCLGRNVPGDPSAIGSTSPTAATPTSSSYLSSARPSSTRSFGKCSLVQLFSLRTGFPFPGSAPAFCGLLTANNLRPPDAAG